MKYIKLYESHEDDKVGEKWKEDFLRIYDLFCELEDKNIARLDFQSGYHQSSNRSSGYLCFIKDGVIQGNEEHQKFMSYCQKTLYRVCVYPNFKNSNYSPFKDNNYQSSYFDNSLDLFTEIVDQIKVIKKRLDKDYKVGVTMQDEVIYVNFLAR